MNDQNVPRLPRAGSSDHGDHKMTSRGVTGSKHSMPAAYARVIGPMFAAVLGVLANAAWGHEIRPAVVTANFARDGNYSIELVVNMEAVLAGVSPVHQDTDQSPNAQSYNALRALPPDALKARILEFVPAYLAGIRLELDGVRATPEVELVEVPPTGDLALSRLTHVRLRGRAPGAAQFRWTYPAQYGSNVLRVRREGDPDVTATWLKEGAPSAPIPLTGEMIAKTRAQVALEYTVLGFTHILPKGLDHILFVLGLFLLSVRVKPLLIQVTAFTVAHSITLGLTIYGIFSLSPAIVEPLIAASIVYVALENVATSELKPWRPFVVFGFGLLHGMGFAGVLQEVGLPRSEFLTALVTFNLGVELGQLSVIAAAYLLVGMWGRGHPWYRARVVIPASLAIAAVGLYWTIERVAG